MKINTIINRYIVKEIIFPFFVIFLFFNFIFLMAKILEITDVIINYNASFFDMVLLLFFMTPDFLYFVFPIATMISVLIAFIQLSSNNEIIVLKSSGININRLILPVAIFCFVNMCITGWITCYGVSYGRLASKKLLSKIAEKNFNIMIKEKMFNEKFGDMTIYVDKIDPITKKMERVFIEENPQKESSNTIIAPKGILLHEKDKTSFILKLFDGVINNINIKDNSSFSANFSAYDVNVDLMNKNNRSSFFGKNEMNIVELYNFIKNSKEKSSNYYDYFVYSYQKITIPIACILLGLSAMFISFYKNNQNKQFFTISFGFIVMVLYYSLIILSESLGKINYLLSPALCLWIPNIVMSIIGLYFFVFAKR